MHNTLTLVGSVSLACLAAPSATEAGGQADSYQRTALRGMVWVPAGDFPMGWDGPESRPDERPAHSVHVDGLWIDETEVANAEYRAFVEATGYVTTAERPVDWGELKRQVPPGTPKPREEDLGGDARASALGTLATRFRLSAGTSEHKGVTASQAEFPQDQDEQVSPDPWVFSLGTGVMFPSMQGELSVAETTADIDLSFDDIVDNFDVIGASGNFEAWKDATWGIRFSAAYMRLEGTFDELDDPQANRIDVDFEQTTVNLGMGYRVYNDTPGGPDAKWPRLIIDALGGGRYQYIKNELQVDQTTTLGGDDDWIEPVIGARATLLFNRKFSLTAGGDVGGFGIGDASDLTWSFSVLGGYMVTGRTSIHAGYSMQGIDFSSGSGESQFGGDYITEGITLALSFRF